MTAEVDLDTISLEQRLDVLYKLCSAIVVSVGIDWVVPNHNLPERL